MAAWKRANLADHRNVERYAISAKSPHGVRAGARGVHHVSIVARPEAYSPAMRSWSSAPVRKVEL